jgi:hypothetical protein
MVFLLQDPIPADVRMNIVMSLAGIDTVVTTGALGLVDHKRPAVGTLPL